MISRRKFAILIIIAILICAVIITAAVFSDRFSSGLGGLMVYWDGDAPDVGKIAEIPCSVSGPAFVSKMYLVEADGARQLSFRFTCPGLKDLSEIKLFANGREIPNRTGSFLDRVMGIKCRTTHVSLEAPGETPVSGELRLVFLSGDNERFEIRVQV